MSLLFGSRYSDEEDSSYDGIMASRMRRSFEEDCGPVHQQRQPSRPRVANRRRTKEKLCTS